MSEKKEKCLYYKTGGKCKMQNNKKCPGSDKNDPKVCTTGGVLSESKR